MITDWLSGSWLATLGRLVAALDCAIILPLLQFAFPGTSARRRLARALFICATMAVVPDLVPAGARGFGNGLFAFVSSSDELGQLGMLRLGAYVVGGGLLLSWLIPVYTEGRSLRSMGWVGRGALGYLAAGIPASRSGWCWPPCCRPATRYPTSTASSPSSGA